MSKVIMFIDDDADDRELFGEALSEIDQSMTLQTASSAKQALQQLTATHAILPDVIFLDINMPVVGGWELLTMLKENTDLRHIPVIMYSTSSKDQEKEKALNMGAVGLVSKPSSFETLKNHLRKVRAYLLDGPLPPTLEIA